MADDLYQLGAEIKQKGKSLGFDLVGIAPAGASRYGDYFRQWLDDGRAGTMEYLAKRFEERTDPATYLPEAKTVICLAMNYHVPLRAIEKAEDANAPAGKIARYALGDDYHEVIKPRLHALADWMRERIPLANFRCAVDTAPVMEKELAARTGVGWMGKNTCLINQEIGSWLLLGEVITTLELPVDTPAIDRCGTCRRCIDACPTQAITAPYQLDARRCISYLTIEHRGEIDAELAEKMGDWIYGCDICQDVCPWNRKAPIAIGEELHPRFETGTLPLAEVEGWSAEDYRLRLRHSAMKRVKLPVLQRNARMALGNQAKK